MDYKDVLSLIGGLALFLYGMKMMSDGLEATAGHRMKSILERLTANRFLGVAVGAGITAVIQSSSATTVMVVGFVNSGLMTLRQAIWVIMGANIGTTITGQLIALDMSAIAPIFAIIGAIMAVMMKSKKANHIGSIVAGLGILFIGMGMMSASMVPLRESEVFVSIMTQFRNPIFGVLAGALFTALIQSSSASIGILQGLAKSGAIGLPSAVYVLFGQNIGTCITAVIASIGTSRNAKRATIVHLMFNVIGTFIFVVICMLLPFTKWMEMLTPNLPASQIANTHLIFNIVTTGLLLPFGQLLEKIACKILPEIPEENTQMQLHFIPPNSVKVHTIGSVAIAISQIQNEVVRMYKLARENVEYSFSQIGNFKQDVMKKIEENEEYVDFLNAEISKYISHIVTVDMPEKDGNAINAYFKILGNIERISDHAMNIAGYAGKKITFSDEAMKEIANMKKVSLDAIEFIDFRDTHNQYSILGKVTEAEQNIDDLTDKYRQNQVERMRDSICNGEACVIYSELVTDFERLGDHLLNIAQECIKFNAEESLNG